LERKRHDNCEIKRRLSIAIIAPREAAGIPAAIRERVRGVATLFSRMKASHAPGKLSAG